MKGALDMSYGIMRVQKFKAAGCKGIEIHDLREKEFTSHTNPDIDWERSKENYTLHQGRSAEQTFYQAVKERINELDLPRAVRKDAVVMSQALFTSDHGFFENLSNEEQRRYFEKCYEWAKAQFGEKNVISATVHLDEYTPHMHVNFVPVTEDGRLSAKEVLTPARIREMHDLFHEQVGKDFGLDRGERWEPGKKKKTHLHTEEYKLAKAEERAAKERAAKAVREAQKKEQHLEALSKKEKAVKAKIERLEGNLKGRIITARELDAIKPQATLPGGIGLYRVEQINDLKKTSYAAIRYKERCVDLDKRYKTVEAENARLKPPKINISEELEKNTIRIKQEQTAKLNQKIIDRLPVPLVQEAKAQIDREAAELARSISHGPSR
jgi:hypothetical protein